MRNKETGEFELVVGNGQLVSGFFIVILLFAVGVAMGYILGQNSEKSAKTEAAGATPCVAETRPQPAQAAAQTPKPVDTPPADTPPATSADSQPQPTTQPAKDPSAPAPAVTKPVAAPTPTPVPASNGAEAPAGFFWQVTAISNQESLHATVETLKKRGFPAYLVPGRNGLTRVLVGPYADTKARSQAKTDLEAAGFKGPVQINRE